MARTRILAIFMGLAGVAAVAGIGPLVIGATRTDGGPKLAHMVYFKLKDGSGGNRAKLVAACKLFLSGHEGVEYFSTGSLAGDLNKEFNDRDFDVSLNLVFVDKDAHDKYQESDRHKKFIEENLELIEKVRVFDSYLSPAPAARRPSNGLWLFGRRDGALATDGLNALSPAWARGRGLRRRLALARVLARSRPVRLRIRSGRAVLTRRGFPGRIAWE